MNNKLTGRYFKFIFSLTSLILISLSFTVTASEFDPCTDLIIDQSTNIAYGAHGAPYDGEFTCFRDAEKTKPTIKRKFNNGVASDQHFCFDKQGVPKWVIVYLNGKPWKMDVFAKRYNKPKNSNLSDNYNFTACDASDWTRDWCDKANFKDCIPK